MEIFMIYQKELRKHQSRESNPGLPVVKVVKELSSPLSFAHAQECFACIFQKKRKMVIFGHFWDAK